MKGVRIKVNNNELIAGLVAAMDIKIDDGMPKEPDFIIKFVSGILETMADEVKEMSKHISSIALFAHFSGLAKHIEDDFEKYKHVTKEQCCDNHKDMAETVKLFIKDMIELKQLRDSAH